MRRFRLLLITMLAILIHSFACANEGEVAQEENLLADDDNKVTGIEKTKDKKQLNLFATQDSSMATGAVLEKENEEKIKEKVKPERPQHKLTSDAEDGFLHFNAMVMIGNKLIDTWFNGQRCCDALKPLNLKVVAEDTGAVEVEINGHRMTMFPGDRVVIPKPISRNTQVQ